MHPTASLIATTLLLLALPPAHAAANEGVRVDDIHGRGYWVWVQRDRAEAPHHGSSYDCAGESGPRDLNESVGWNEERLRDGAFNFGAPRVNPRCIALHASAGGISDGSTLDLDAIHPSCTLAPLPPCGGARAAPRLILPEARVTYNVTSGEYTVQVLAPVEHAMQGDAGLHLLFDCRDCDPPW